MQETLGKGPTADAGAKQVQFNIYLMNVKRLGILAAVGPNQESLPSWANNSINREAKAGAPGSKWEHTAFNAQEEGS